ncbi:MAG: IS110 family transposase [Terriglobales bacterium]
MKRTTIGIDLAKNVMHAVALDGSGKELWRKRYARRKLLPALAQVAGCEVALECGSGAHYWAREIGQLGHPVKLLAPQHVVAYRSGNKHDFNDARAIAEAASRAEVRTVPVKTVAQQQVQALHRIRSGFLHERTARINQWRGLLAEYGVVLPTGARAFMKQAAQALDTLAEELSVELRRWLQSQLEWLRAIDGRMAELDQVLKRQAHSDARAALLLRELPGVGVLTATALSAAIGDAAQFRRARDCAAWMGVVPKQHSTGGKTQLLGISKRGDTYLRTLLIHGGRSVVRQAARKSDPFSQWVNRLKARRGANIAAVAVANKNARMAWALLRKQAAGLLPG